MVITAAETGFNNRFVASGATAAGNLIATKYVNRLLIRSFAPDGPYTVRVQRFIGAGLFQQEDFVSGAGLKHVQINDLIADFVKISIISDDDFNFTVTGLAEMNAEGVYQLVKGWIQ